MTMPATNAPPPPPAATRPAPPPPQTTAKPEVKRQIKVHTGPVEFRQPRGVLCGVEGFGKTTIAANAIAANGGYLVMVGGETGYDTLLSRHRVPEIQRIGPVDSWAEMLDVVDFLTEHTQSGNQVWIDAAGGVESLCHQHVGQRDFDGDMGPKGFLSYHKGYDMAVNDWNILLQRLEVLHGKGVGVWMLSHIKIKPFSNPTGEDFSRYVADMHDKTWGPTHKWADAVLFGKFYEVVKKEKGASKGKGIGGAQRVIYTERRDAWDAKNRYGMPEMLELDDDLASGWNTIWNAITGADGNV